MPRGGRRRGAGRKTTWVSGCSFEDTAIIRVPKYLKDEILDIAHRLDAGEEFDLVSKSIKERNDYLEGKVLELEKELNQPKQLEIPSALNSDFWNALRNNVLKSLKMGSQSKTYKRVEQALNREIHKAN